MLLAQASAVHSQIAKVDPDYKRQVRRRYTMDPRVISEVLLLYLQRGGYHKLSALHILSMVI